MQPSLAVTYNSSGSNGWLGVGWDLEIPAITVDTRWGVPRYDAEFETETYMLAGQQLSPVAHVGEPRPRTGGADAALAVTQFHTRVEGAFQRITRHGNHPSNYWWEIIDKFGTRSVYGGRAGPDGPAVLTDAKGNIFRWALREVGDLHGNGIRYSYDFESNVGLPGGTVPGTQLYVQSINYTQLDASRGAYTVQFLRRGGRPDVVIDARGGFKSVTADLLDRIEILFQAPDADVSQSVRTYEFTYRQGAFGKTLLASVAQLGSQGQILGAPHEFDYFPARLEFDAPRTWDAGTSDRVSAGIRGWAHPTALSGSITHSANFHGYMGFSPVGWSKWLSVGPKVGGRYSNNQGILALTDLNGDGLPDKVFCTDWQTFGFTCGGFAFRPNISGPGGPPAFGDREPLGDLPAISGERSSMFSFGLEAYAFGGSVVGNTSTTFTYGYDYFSDVNGDGLLDLVREGSVLYNHVDDGVPHFTQPNGLMALADASEPGIDPEVMPDFSQLQKKTARTFPLQDALRRWVAPYAGEIQISGDVALIEDGSPERQQYDAADGVRVAIQHNVAELWARHLAADDYTAHSPGGLERVSVQRGDRIYFRVQSIEDGFYDQVAWNPTIRYLDVPSVLDVNGLDAFSFEAGRDFTLAGRRRLQVAVPMSGSVRLKGRLDKARTTDDVTLIVEKNGKRIFSERRAWNETAPIVLAGRFAVTTNEDSVDSIRIRLKVDSPIDLAALRWSKPPALVYISTDPVGAASTDNIAHLPRFDVPYEIDTYPISEPALPQRPWVVPTSRPFRVLTRLRLAAPDAPDEGRVTFTIKRPGALLRKRSVELERGQWKKVDIRVEADRGQNLYFDFSAYSPRVRAALEIAPVRVRYRFRGGGKVVTTRVPSRLHGAARRAEIGGGLFAQPYRGWSFAAYNGNGERSSLPIDESRLVLDQRQYLRNGELRSACTNARYIERVAEDGLSLEEFAAFPCDPADDMAHALGPSPAARAWRGPDEFLWVKRSSMSSSRLGPDAIDLPGQDAVRLAAAGSAPRAVVRLGRNVEYALGGGIGPLGGSGVEGASWNDIDFLDMNGDSYPDIVTRGRIQYTTPSGALREQSEPVNVPPETPALTQIRRSNNSAGSISIGGTVAHVGSDSHGDVVAGIGPPEDQGSGSQMLSLGLSGGLGGSGSDMRFDVQDINGDGLPDRIFRKGPELMVSLNLGYSFAAPESWGKASISFGRNENGSLGSSLGLSLGFNDGIYSFAGGTSSSTSKSAGEAMLLDINGDGLLDRVEKAPGSSIRIRFNPGNGFSRESADPQTQMTKAVSGQPCRAPAQMALVGTVRWQEIGVCDSSTTLGGGAYGSFPLPMFFCFFVCSIIVNTGADASESVARQEGGFRDIDGDGMLDYVSSTDDGALSVSLNMTGPANLLRAIDRPLGARIELDYARDGNTYDQPQSHWVLTKVAVNDGHPGDGVDVQVRSFRYEGGRFDRAEREFFGYRTVVEETHGEGRIYRRLVREYLNDNYYENGLLEREVIEDEFGVRFVETVHTYIFRDVLTRDSLDDPDTTAPVFPELRRTDRYFYEGNETPVKSTFTTYEYDEFGNIDHLVDAGDVGDADDLRAFIEYEANCPDTYLVGEPTTIGVSGGGRQLRLRGATVDCATGNVLQVRENINSAEDAYTDLDYYGNGNLRRVTGPPNLHGDPYVLEYTYDEQLETHIATITDSFKYQSSATYDPKYGTVASTTDINGNTASYDYDHFGRLEAIWGPYQPKATSPPTISIAYHPDAAVPWALTSHLDEFGTPADPVDVVTFADGLGRVVQTKRDATVHASPTESPAKAMAVSGAVTYDFLGRVVEQRYPITPEPLGTPGVFNPSVDDVPPTKTAYDILDRVVKTTLPDQTFTTTAHGFGLDRDGTMQFRAVTTDANDVRTTTYSNVRGQVVAAHEFLTLPDGTTQTLWMSYTYDAMGQLLKVQDAEMNPTTFDYDNLGRRTFVDTPDGGRTETIYDLASNRVALVTENLRDEDSRIQYDYDFTRLASIEYPSLPDNNVAYEYGDPGASGNRAGRIEVITDGSGREERSYGKLGELNREVHQIATETSPLIAYTTEYTYDSFGRLRSLAYPDGEVLTYRYDAGGLVRSVEGFKDNFEYGYIRRMEYDKFGQRAFVEVGNGIRTSYEYYPDDRRLEHLGSRSSRTGGPGLFQNLTYTYDDVGNVESVTNDVPPRSDQAEFGGSAAFSYHYDDLYRLEDASGVYHMPTGERREYTLQMTYDRMHNITSKHQLDVLVDSVGQRTQQTSTSYSWDYHFDPVQPHAPTQVGDRTFIYDENGNQESWTSGIAGSHREIVWDDENRIQSVSTNEDVTSFKYDDSGSRVVKDSILGEVSYVNPYFTVRDGKVGTKHVWVGTTRVLSKRVHGEPAGGPSNQPFESDMYFFHPDQLGSTQYATNAAGRITEHVEYLAFGEPWIQEATGAQGVDGVRHLFTGQELDQETGLYYLGARSYDPKLSLFVSVDPFTGTVGPDTVPEPYVYAHNNPVRYVDPVGLQAEEGTGSFTLPAWLRGTAGGGVIRSDRTLEENRGQIVIDEQVSRDPITGLSETGYQWSLGRSSLRERGQLPASDARLGLVGEFSSLSGQHWALLGSPEYGAFGRLQLDVGRLEAFAGLQGTEMGLTLGYQFGRARGSLGVNIAGQSYSIYAEASLSLQLGVTIGSHTSIRTPVLAFGILHTDPVGETPMPQTPGGMSVIRTIMRGSVGGWYSGW